MQKPKLIKKHAFVLPARSSKKAARVRPVEAVTAETVREWVRGARRPQSLTAREKFAALFARPQES